MFAFGMSIFGYWISVILGAAGLGVLWYEVEILLVEPVRRYWHDFWRPNNPMPATEHLGILLHRPFSQKQWIVGFVSLVQSLWFVLSGHTGILAEILAFAVSIPAFVFAFVILGPRVHSFALRGKYLERFDRMGNAIETMSKDEAKARAKQMLGRLPGTVFALAQKAWRYAFPAAKPAVQPPVQQAESPAAAKPEEVKEDPRDVIDRYTRGRR